MIFVTLGSQKFQFNRLLKKIDELIEVGEINETVFAQTGASDYIPVHYSFKPFLDRSEFREKIAHSDIVITHGGTGVIIGAVKEGKKVIAVPRLATYGEHVDDHQLQLLHQFDELGIIMACYDLETLGEAYHKVQEVELKPYISNTQVIIKSIEDYIESLQTEQ